MPKSRLVLLTCCVAQLMVTLDSSVLSVALADLRNDLGLTTAELPWAVNAFAIPLASLLLFAGRLSDRYGARRILLVGVVMFGAASLLAGVATSPGILFTGRALQGAGAALMSTSCLALLSQTFPSGPTRARAFGLWAAAAGSGGAIGVIVGGVLVDLACWRWTLLINIPIAAILITLLGRIPNLPPRGRPALSLPSTILFAAAAIAIVYAISSIGENTELAAAVPWVCLAVGALGVLIFLVAERRSNEPLIPRLARGNRELWLLMVSIFLTGGAMTSVFYFGALNFQLFHHLTPMLTGLAFLPLSIGAFIAAALCHLLQSYVGVIPSALIGSAAMLLGLVGIWLGSAGTTPLWMILSSGLFGIGMGVALSSISDAATATLPPGQAGAASGLLTTAQQMGNSVGLATAGAFEASHPLPGFAAGFAAAMVLAAIALAPVVAVVLRLGPQTGRKADCHR